MESFDAMAPRAGCRGYNRRTTLPACCSLPRRACAEPDRSPSFPRGLTPAIADAALALSRMGARMRYTLVTAGETTEEQAKLLNLLRVSGVETLHVKAG